MSININIEKILKEGKGTILDVRSPEEFSEGNVGGSINIPLNEIPERIDEIKRLKLPLILCCASGNRSGIAYNFLSQNKIESINGGSWLTLNNIHSQIQ